MSNIIVGAIIVVVLGIPIRYIIKAKRNGVHCIGCPSGGSCSGSCSGGCSEGCSKHCDSDKHNN